MRRHVYKARDSTSIKYEGSETLSLAPRPGDRNLGSQSESYMAVQRKECLKMNEHTSNGNGTLIDALHGRKHQQSDAESEPILSVLGEVPDIILRAHGDLRKEGRWRAEVSGTIEPNAEDIRALEEHASAMARELYRDEYNPMVIEHDRLRKAEFEKMQNERGETELAEKNAELSVAQQENAVAVTVSDAKQPVVSQTLSAAAIFVLSMSLAPTMHDAIFITLGDDLLNWILSLLFAVAFGVFIALGILSSLEDGGNRTIANWAGLGGGSVIVVGLALFRLKDALGWGEITFCVALMLVEIGTIVFLEGYAGSLRAAYQRFNASRAAAKKEVALLEAAKAHHERCVERLKKVNDSIASHIHFVEERYTRHYRVEEIENASIKAIRDGYLEGVAKNKGRLVGANGDRS